MVRINNIYDLIFTSTHGLYLDEPNRNYDTNAWIAQGTIIQRDSNTDLSGLDRNPTLDNQALAPIFDAQKVQENMEMGQVAGQVGMRAAGDLAGQMGWAEGSPERTILHGVVGAGIAALGGGNVAQGALGAAANQLVIQQMTDYLESQGYQKGTPEFASMMQLASTAVGAAVGGGAGAATALDGTTYNYLTHQQVTDLQKEINRCDGDRVCIESAKSNAEILSANQEQQLISACGGSASSLSGTCKANILAARAYATDPLAAQLGLHVDQNISLQDYLNHRPEWGLVYADNAVSQNGQLMFAPAVAGAGTAVAVAAAPATLAWGQEAWAAYQVATQGYSLGAAAGTGAVASGVTYTLGISYGARQDSRYGQISFGTAFNQRFSYLGLGTSMAVGAVNSMVATQMFQWANVPNAWSNVTSPAGAVIRINTMATGKAAGMAAQGAVQAHEQKQEGK
ncbi:hypothetical protein EO087_06930 [Dyella sp. M7H15-1]|uniref:hypothetical protein n=1 Tax=Dyella sp. M7H15-1 TaxID=2501295 RepID=UPI0010050FB3|nr:hypothetical protein [Dyella sp. M7H15-1]QAU23748.1 hypothetical protein EO087_06930 [Dyella sp. M7H15-1]